MDRLTFSTQVPLDSHPVLTLEKKVVTVGSCFSEHLGRKLIQHKWETLVNPFGTLFHPIAIFELLICAFKGLALSEKGFVQSDGTWFHLSLPRAFHGESPDDLQDQFLAISTQVREYCLTYPACLIITLGTAQVYIEKSSGIMVANCHKLPQHLFEKRLISSEEIDRSWQALASCLPSTLSLIWTLSPVRHVRESLTVNSVSKAILRVWLHKHLNCGPSLQTYFPAYEIMIDELRDYRFYDSDLLHPNQVAIDYLWGLFIQYRMPISEQNFCREWSRIRQRLEHRPFHTNAPSWQKFLEDTKTLLEKLDRVDVKNELEWINSNLKNPSGK